jgi:hypothetical protein
MTACPLFIELCAGTAAVSLRLARARARPPVSRMGSKSGYADALLGLAGLRPGQGAAHYLWCEPDPGCRLLLEAYRDAALARAAADIIRGWAAEDPRALWERLRAEGPPRGPEASPGGQVFAHEVARWLNIAGWDMGQAAPGFRHPYGGKSASGRTGNGCDGLTSAGLARRTEGLPEVPATIAPDARAVDPREVARWVWTWGRSFNTKGPDAGFLPSESSTGTPVWNAHPPEWFAAACDRLPELPATILPDARVADLRITLPHGTVVFIDPPYVGTTPYAHTLPRADVVALARRWAAAGALVMVCEAEPIPELVADGWGYRDIAHARKGQARTFSRQSREVVTMNRAPVHVPAEQVGLFGGAR